MDQLVNNCDCKGNTNQFVVMASITVVDQKKLNIELPYSKSYNFYIHTMSWISVDFYLRYCTL